MFRIVTSGLVGLTAVAALAAQSTPNTLSTAERREGFVLLFDGVSTRGWHQLPLQNDQNAGPWKARDGVLTYEPGESWLASDEAYSDFVLRLDYRTTGTDTDSGIFMRSPAAGYPSWTGMELEMKGNDAGAAPGLRTSMSLIGSAAALKAAHKAPGEWNTVDITLNKTRFTVLVNGEKIHDFSLDDPAYAVDRQHTPLADRAKTGFIGFQAHRNGAPAEYRNVRIKVIK
jgi:hypothetical protein